MKTEKSKKSVLRKSTEILIVVGLVIAAFVSAKYRQGTLLGAAGVWAVINCGFYGRDWIQKGIQAIRNSKPQAGKDKSTFNVPTLHEDDPLRKLLRHVNHRITDKVQTCFPGASWDWDSKPNVNFLMNGGVARIKLINAETYNYAEVRLDEREQLGFTLITAVAFDDIAKMQTGAEEVVSDFTPDIVAWYENVGGKIIDDTIADLNSRGIRTLSILPGGELAIVSDGKDVVQGKVENLPDQSAWSKLINYLIDERQLGAALLEGRIVLNW